MIWSSSEGAGAAVVDGGRAAGPGADPSRVSATVTAAPAARNSTAATAPTISAVRRPDARPGIHSGQPGGGAGQDGSGRQPGGGVQPGGTGAQFGGGLKRTETVSPKLCDATQRRAQLPSGPGAPSGASVERLAGHRSSA